MAMKGIFFSIDALFGVIIAVTLVVTFSSTLLRFQEPVGPNLYLSNIANDALSSMDKNDTLDTLDSVKINQTLDRILPDNIGYILDVKVFACSIDSSGTFCDSFPEVGAKSFRVVLDPKSENNPIIAKRAFLTFDSSNRVQYFNKAEMRAWLR